MKRKANCGAKTKLNEATRRTNTEKLLATWSPKQIVGRLFDREIASSMETVIQVVHGAFHVAAFRTATTDRGKEFSCHERIRSSLGVLLYFADPYASWQRGSNENAKGLLREFFPKESDFAQVGDGELADALAKINERPRKCLDWRTAHEAFNDEVLRLI